MALRQSSILIDDRSGVGEARRAVAAAAEAMGFDDERRSDIAIVATEAANNVLKHARRGELLVCPVPGAGKRPDRLDLLALDCGPGIENLARASADGFSTFGTAGEGLGAIARQADTVEMLTGAGRGVVLLARFLAGGKPDPEATPRASSFGVVNIPLAGEQECGDGFFVSMEGTRLLYVVADGLGHGPLAAEAAAAAVDAVRSHVREGPSDLIAHAHDALRSTRGAAMSVAVADADAKVLTFCGVGNVNAMLATSTTTKAMMAQSGTVGAVIPRVLQEYRFPFTASTRLVMYSDGMLTKISPSGYPGLMMRDAQLMAGVLYRDFTRRRDDATVLVANLAAGVNA